MGCDIHLVVERKLDDRWVTVHTMSGHNRAPRQLRNGEHGWSTPVARSRNYRRFAALAGIRGDGPEPRGLPDDLSETGQYLVEFWGADGHSHSWLAVTDAAAVFLETEDETLDEWAIKNPTVYYFDVEPGDADDHRIVFWFDN